MTYADVRVPLQRSKSGFGRETSFSPTAAGDTEGRGGGSAHGDNTSRHTLFGAEWFPSTIHLGHTNQHHNTHQFGQYAVEL